MNEEMEKCSDQDLVRLFKEGNHQAFEVLIKRYEQRLFNTIVGIVRNHHEAEDLFQEVLLKVFHKIEKYHGDSSFFTWLYRVGVNSSLDYLRKCSRRPTFSLEKAMENKTFPLKKLAIQEKEPGEQAQWTEGADLIQEVLQTMKPKHRVVLQLKEQEGLSYQEIAEILKCSIGTVESRLSRARAQLKKKIAPFFEKGGAS